MAAPIITRVNDRLDGEIWRWPTVTSVDQRAWRWPKFTPAEMACRKTGVVLIRPSFMDDLQLIRNRLSFALPITSGYRSPEHNMNVSSTGAMEGPHVSGQAVDIGIKFADAFALIKIAIEYEFKGIGTRQHGKLPGRFVHLDKWDGRKTESLWTYNEALNHG